MKNLVILLAVGLIMSACTWVELSDEGKRIRIVGMADVATCKKIGTVNVALKDKIAGFDRDEDKVKRELENLARNTAADMEGNGDSIVPAGPIKDGKQNFDVYKCVNP